MTIIIDDSVIHDLAKGIVIAFYLLVAAVILCGIHSYISNCIHNRAHVKQSKLKHLSKCLSKCLSKSRNGARV